MRDQTVHNKTTEELSRGCVSGMAVEGKTERERIGRPGKKSVMLSETAQ
jgi:hypothetical protein